MRSIRPLSMTGFFILWTLVTLTCQPCSGASLSGGQSSSFYTEASYYTYKSCIREGTSGVWTASGERYDENGFTCASRDFKYGTWLKVRNLRNNRSVMVRVNDFGPNKKLYNKGRKIDLSYGAAKSIGMVKDGIAKVEVTPI